MLLWLLNVIKKKTFGQDFEENNDSEASDENESMCHLSYNVSQY